MSDETLAVLELLHTAVQRAGGGGPRAAHVRVEQLLQHVVLIIYSTSLHYSFTSASVF